MASAATRRLRPSEYGLSYGAADYWAKGTWRHEKNSVVLNSTGRKEAPFRLLRSEAGEPGTTRVWVSNDFYFEIDGDSIAQVFFKDERLAIDGKILMMKYWNKEEPVRYEKQ